MEMEGRGFSDLLRNTSEEIFLKSMMENPIGSSAPSLEMLGFKNISQSFRGDSEELFNSWLMNGEIAGYNSSNGLRNRQASRRILLDHSNQQNGASFQKKNNNENASHHHVVSADEHSTDAGQGPLRNVAEKGMHSSNLYLAKAWFNSSQPMTRSRSSELRRRYATMQSSQMAAITPAPMGEMSFMSPSNSSVSFNAPPLARSDTVSSVVSMLKGTLERKKLNSKVEKGIFEGSSYGMLSSQVAVKNINFNECPPNQVTGPPTAFQIVSSMQITAPSNLSKIEKCVDLNMEGNLANHGQVGAASCEPSQSESCTAAPTFSTGFEVCDDPAHSGHTISNSVSSRRYAGSGTSEREMKANDFKDRIFENSFNDARKKGNLIRMGSISSSGASVDKTDRTKKRRVERSRKMTEAKERNSTPPLPSDMQSVVKRCENLEKEVRSLKLNLAFMNRKDSEQTKQIEELQKQNEELVIEKGCLLEEIERIISDSGGK
ncbi:hypothetical protein AXF42_Ash006030 [Apostasia shenzhenica]|uniref:Protein CYCLOPS n=1 Tax=Apostasia shenzhenica TaxID=1088818 RepID=A0A2I0B016_9ASPA|nr:hypothetical protein AXF42_Ash006030 [Apostasia shenzhenica]